MSTKISLVPVEEHTSYAPLAVLGYCLTRTDFLSPVFAGLDLSLKTVDHTPSEKLLDVLVSILAGCRSWYCTTAGPFDSCHLCLSSGKYPTSLLSRSLPAFQRSIGSIGARSFSKSEVQWVAKVLKCLPWAFCGE